MQNNSPFSSNTWRIYWRSHVFTWLKENRLYDDFSLDNALKRLENNLSLREASVAAFWSTYLCDDWPPLLDEETVERVKKLLDTCALDDSRAKNLKALAFVKIHLATLLTVCSIRPDLPIIESPSVRTILEQAIAAYNLAEGPDIIDEIIDDPGGWGNEHFVEDIFTFSLVLVGGIVKAELSLWLLEQRNYEQALWSLTNSAWNLCAASVHETSEGVGDFKAYLPHSLNQFNIQEVADVFEEIKKHPKSVNHWDLIQMDCDAIQYLGYFGLYDFSGDIKDTNGDELGSVEYWGKAITFAEVHRQIEVSPFPIVTQDDKERIETQERLKRDYFPSTWSKFDEESQDIIIDLEIQWIHNRVSDMVKMIRQLLERELISTFPLLEGMANKKDVRLILTRMKEALLDNSIIRAYINGLKIDNAKKQWSLNELPIFLQKVIHARNFFEKEQHLQNKKTEKYQDMIGRVSSIHQQFFGIGGAGVLPILAEIKAVTNKQ